MQRLASTSSIPKWFIVKVCPMTTCRINRGNTTSFGDSCALSFQQSYISQVLYKPKWILYFYIGKLGQHWKIHNFSNVSYFWVFFYFIFSWYKNTTLEFLFLRTQLRFPHFTQNYDNFQYYIIIWLCFDVSWCII